VADAPQLGDYVLATKYEDGDPCDHFVVGFVSGWTRHGRWLVEDAEGRNQRHNGFRRAARITDEEGRKLVAMMPQIGDIQGPSLWWHLAKMRGEQPVEGSDSRFNQREMEEAEGRQLRAMLFVSMTIGAAIGMAVGYWMWG